MYRILLITYRLLFYSLIVYYALYFIFPITCSVIKVLKFRKFLIHTTNNTLCSRYIIIPLHLARIYHYNTTRTYVNWVIQYIIIFLYGTRHDTYINSMTSSDRVLPTASSQNIVYYILQYSGYIIYYLGV